MKPLSWLSWMAALLAGCAQVTLENLGGREYPASATMTDESASDVADTAETVSLEQTDPNSPPTTGTADSDTGASSETPATPCNGDCTAELPSCDSDNKCRCTATSCAVGRNCDSATGECVPDVCGGALVEGGCWYIGSEFQSCTTVCANHGGYDERTATFAGSGGTNEDCAAVLDALRLPGTYIGNTVPGNSGVGCVYWSGNSMRLRQISPPTSAEAMDASYRRVCACTR